MIICATCTKENEDFFKFCLGCGADLTGAAKLDEGPTVESSSMGPPSAADPATRRDGASRKMGGADADLTCRICGASHDPAFAFCADCGASFAELTKTGPVHAVAPEPPRSGVARGKLVLVREDGTDGDAYDLDADGAIIGRDSGHVTFPADDFLASAHAELTYEGDDLVVRPLPSTNDVFIRIFDEI
ncbi:MAG: zinc ribbon domain-containing protein, partial [Myxococcota bacterium]|nr:zinc ribbon domain-containing protein [Myxococcota bacterium]